jgi:hypothetical protein
MCRSIFILYHRTGAEQRFFTHPAKYQPHWPTVHILVLPSDLTERRRRRLRPFRGMQRKKSPLKWHAAAFIVNPSAYLHKSGGRSCCWCGRAYKSANFRESSMPPSLPATEVQCLQKTPTIKQGFYEPGGKKDRCDSFLRKERSEKRKKARREEEAAKKEEKRRRRGRRRRRLPRRRRSKSVE